MGSIGIFLHIFRIRYLNFVRKEIISAERLEKRQAARKKAMEAAEALATVQAAGAGTQGDVATATSSTTPALPLPSVTASGSAARRNRRQAKQFMS